MANSFNILIVDDVIENIELAITILQDEGYNLFFATNGNQAIEMVEAKPQKFDFILLDIMMPELDGFDTCIHLKSHEDTANIPIIFITAKNDINSTKKDFLLGAVDYITKPFYPEVLLVKVRNHLKLQQANKFLKQHNINIASIAIESMKKSAQLALKNIHFKPAKILMVDDITENSALIKDFFATTNIKVSTANNGQQAINMVTEQDFDLIILDIYMPDLNGYQATKIIKSIKDVPVVVLTASLMNEYEIEEREIFDSFLTKPVFKSDLYLEIMKYLPYEEMDKTTVTGVITESIVLSTAQYEQEKSYVKEVIKCLLMLQVTCDELLATNDVNGIKVFVKQINDIMADYPTTSVQKYTDKLSDNIKNVNIIVWRRGLQSFNELILELQCS